MCELDSLKAEIRKERHESLRWTIICVWIVLTALIKTCVVYEGIVWLGVILWGAITWGLYYYWDNAY